MTKLTTKDVMGAYPLVKQDFKSSENHFSTHYFPISEITLLFGRFTGIRGMMAWEIQVHGEKPVALPRCGPYRN